MEKRLIQVLNKEKTDIMPVWLMRQAGRYLPEYRATRAQAGSFLQLCYTPELAAEVTIQPIRRFGFDAAILFADILLVPQALGLDLWFETGEGPKLSKVTSKSDIDALKPVSEIDKTLAPIYETVSILSKELPKETTLIGFAGAPWTVATYMVQGGGSKDHALPRKWLAETPDEFMSLIWKIEEATIHYLSKQIEAGAEVVKLFDSWAGALPVNFVKQVSIDPMARIAKALKETYPDIKVIAFPRGIGASYLDAGSEYFDAIALDAGVNLDWAFKAMPNTVFQGNLDPMAMVAGGDYLESETRRIMKGVGDRPHIFNLGHGITPDADPDNVSRLLEIIRGA